MKTFVVKVQFFCYVFYFRSKGAEFEKAFSLSKDLEQEDVQKVMSQLKISGYNRGVVRNVSNAAEKIGRQQIAEAVEKTERGDDS